MRVLIVFFVLISVVLALDPPTFIAPAYGDFLGSPGRCLFGPLPVRAVLEADDEGGRVGGLHLRRGNNSGQHVSEFLLFLDRGGRLLHAVRTGGSAGGKPPYAKAG